MMLTNGKYMITYRYVIHINKCVNNIRIPFKMQINIALALLNFYINLEILRTDSQHLITDYFRY